MIKFMNQVEELYKDTVEPNSVIQYPTIECFSRYLIDNEIVKATGVEVEEVKLEVVEYAQDFINVIPDYLMKRFMLELEGEEMTG